MDAALRLRLVRRKSCDCSQAVILCVIYGFELAAKQAAVFAGAHRLKTRDQEVNVTFALQAPVKFSLARLGGLVGGPREGSVCVNALNRFFFSTTAGLVFTWRVMLGGEPLSVGEPLQLDPEMWHPGGSVLIEPQVWTVCKPRTKIAPSQRTGYVSAFSAGMPSNLMVQESAELRLPLEIADLIGAVDSAYSKVQNRAPPEVFLEMRAQLTTAAPWAPMVTCFIP